MKDRCEMCGARLSYEKDIGKYYCKICGWCPEDKSDEENPKYIG